MRVLGALLAMSLAIASLASATTYLVRPDGTGDYPTIQAAIDAAAPGDEVVLSDGVFTGSGNRDLTFRGKPITVRSDSDVAEQCIIDCQGTAGENHRGFLFVSGETVQSTLRGITIINGYMSGTAIGSGGGALFIADGSPSIMNCVFLENTAHGGGGVSCYHLSEPRIVECRFVRNAVPSVGAGLYCYFLGSPEVVGCVFEENSPDGAFWHGESSPSFSTCSVTGHARYGLRGEEGSWTIEDCRFYGNRGPGVLGHGASATIARCDFWGNRAPEGPAIYVGSFCSALVEGCLFYDNIADVSGGAVYCEEASSLEMQNCTLAFNHSDGTSGIDGTLGAVTLNRTILAFNTGGECLRGTATLECCDIFGNPGGDWVGDIADQYGVSGNISQNPLFCDPDSFDFSLHADSPCVPFSPPNPECDLIGAEPVGCQGTPVQETTWGAMKALFRGDAK